MTDDEKLRLLHRIDEMLFTDNGPNPYESGKDIQQSRIEGLIADNQKLREWQKELVEALEGCLQVFGPSLAKDSARVKAMEKRAYAALGRMPLPAQPTQEPKP